MRMIHRETPTVSPSSSPPAAEWGALIQTRARTCSRVAALIVAVLGLSGGSGCVVFETLEGVELVTEPQTGGQYYLYVPTTYDAEKAWSLVVTCHGTEPYDTAPRQIKEWKALAETKRFIVVAPKLEGTQGDFPPPPPKQIARQRRDERLILSVVNHVRGSRNIAADRIFLTGWSAGGYAVMFTGLRHPDVFRALSVRQGNFDERFVTPVVPALDPYQPVHVFYGIVDIFVIDQCRASVEWLRDQNMFVRQEKTTGGHRREPERSYNFFLRCVKDYPWVRVRAFVADPQRPRSVRFQVKSSEPVRTYAWDFGDGKTSPVARPTHTFDADGTYNVSVVVDVGRKDPERRTIRVVVPLRQLGGATTASRE